MTQPRKYVIADFNCSGVMTHHWSSMIGYAKLLREQGYETEIWLPSYASSEIIQKFSKVAEIKCFLTSNQYGARSIRDLVAYSISLFSERLYPYIRDTKIGRCAKASIIKFILRKPFREILTLGSETDLVMVFPTLDYFSLQLVKEIIKQDLRVEVSIRRIGSELKNPFSRGTEFEEAIELCNSIGRTTVRLGITTPKLLDKTKAEANYPERILWCPLPPERLNLLSPIDKSKVLTVGFPGAAKSRKGTTRIPEIISHLTKLGIEFRIIFQKAPYPWEGYEEVLHKIRNSGIEYMELDAIQTIEEFERTFNLFDLVYLPYDPISYADADSGILYQAADRIIPIICPGGLGFSEEVFSFGIGVNENGFMDFAKSIKTALSVGTRNQIILYNLARHSATCEFLGIKN